MCLFVLADEPFPMVRFGLSLSGWASRQASNAAVMRPAKRILQHYKNWGNPAAKGSFSEEAILASAYQEYSPTGSRRSHLPRDWAHPCHVCSRTGLAASTSAPGLGSPLPCLRRD